MIQIIFCFVLNFFSQSKKQNKKRRSMLKAINGEDASFTSGYNILRVIAAYPLDVNLSSTSSDIARALRDDNHPLAILKHLPLVACLSSVGTPSMMESLAKTLQQPQ
jgi:hypothetical protein